MKTFRTTLIALVIAFGSSLTLTSCFVDADEEIYDQLNVDNDNAGTNQGETNEGQWD